MIRFFEELYPKVVEKWVRGRRNREKIYMFQFNPKSLLAKYGTVKISPTLYQLTRTIHRRD